MERCDQFQPYCKTMSSKGLGIPLQQGETRKRSNMLNRACFLLRHLSEVACCKTFFSCWRFCAIFETLADHQIAMESRLSRFSFFGFACKVFRILQISLERHDQPQPCGKRISLIAFGIPFSQEKPGGRSKMFSLRCVYFLP